MLKIIPASLHARMLLLSAVATLVALAVAGWAITGVLERFVVEGLDRRLDAEIALVASTVDGEGRVDRARLVGRLGALDEGPGWRWRIEGPDGAVGSADFPRLRDGPPRPPEAPRLDEEGPDRVRPRDGRDEEGHAVHARTLVVETARGAVTLTAVAPRGVVGRPIRGALTPLLMALAALGGLLAIAALVQLRVGLRPLRRLRDQVAAIRRGDRAAVDEDLPTELAGLATELNALAAANAAALATARASAANLAHALKTPVAALALELRDDIPRAAQVARLDATIRHHLARARVDAVDRGAATELAPTVADLVATVRRLHPQRDLAVEAAVAPGLAVAVDPRDLDEMVGNLLDNAAKHARRAVRVSADPDPADPRRLRIVVGDDGTGIAPVARALAIQPGRRLDERGEGHGFGLSIVTELAELYGGALTLGDAEEGGLLATLTLPVRR